MILPIYEIAFDCVDPYRVADFWRNTLDYVQEMPTAEEMEAAYTKHPEWRDIAIVKSSGCFHSAHLAWTREHSPTQKGTSSKLITEATGRDGSALL
jgi:hypothetical protein